MGNVYQNSTQITTAILYCAVPSLFNLTKSKWVRGTFKPTFLFEDALLYQLGYQRDSHSFSPG